MSYKPCILVIGLHDLEPEDIIKSVVQTDLSREEVNTDVTLYKWKISNKYYTADVHFCPLKTKVNLEDEFSSYIEAAVLYFNSNKEDCINKLDSWNGFLQKCNISTKIAACTSCSKISDTRKDAINEWCVRNKYELIELEPEVKEIEEADYIECTGIERVVEILNTHEWPNLLMNGNESNRQTDSIPVTSFDDISSLAENLSASLMTNMTDDDEFENMDQLNTLFKNLQSMKGKISSLDGDEKLKQAETVVKAFWSAIDGDSDEFSDSDNEVACK